MNKDLKSLYLEVPCPLDGDGDRWCRYKCSVLGCVENPKVKRPEDCHTFIQLVNIGLVDLDEYKPGTIS